jgi:hypothetical protein
MGDDPKAYVQYFHGPHPEGRKAVTLSFHTEILLFIILPIPALYRQSPGIREALKLK